MPLPLSFSALPCSPKEEALGRKAEAVGEAFPPPMRVKREEKPMSLSYLLPTYSLWPPRGLPGMSSEVKYTVRQKASPVPGLPAQRQGIPKHEEYSPQRPHYPQKVAASCSVSQAPCWAGGAGLTTRRRVRLVCEQGPKSALGKQRGGGSCSPRMSLSLDFKTWLESLVALNARSDWNQLCTKGPKPHRCC